MAVFNLQNEIVHPDGSIGARGNAAVVAERGVIPRTAALLAAARAAGIGVFYLGSGYNDRYDGLNRTVTLFAEHEPEGRLLLRPGRLRGRRHHPGRDLPRHAAERPVHRRGRRGAGGEGEAPPAAEAAEPEILPSTAPER